MPVILSMKQKENLASAINEWEDIDCTPNIFKEESQYLMGALLLKDKLTWSRAFVEDTNVGTTNIVNARGIISNEFVHTPDATASKPLYLFIHGEKKPKFYLIIKGNFEVTSALRANIFLGEFPFEISYQKRSILR